MKRYLRIILPILFIAVAAIYFNNAAASAWVSNGPPNSYPEAWAHRAMRYFFYGCGFLTIALISFLSLKANAKRIKTKFIIGAIAAIILFSVPHLKKFIDIDSCLDRGGRWDYEHHQCEK